VKGRTERGADSVQGPVDSAKDLMATSLRAHSTTSGRAALLAVIAAVLLAAGCSSDDDASPTTTAKDTTTTTEAADDGAEDPDALALAESINITIDDFAENWTSEPSEEGEGDMDKCFTDVDLDEVKLASADSDDFSIASEDGAQTQMVRMSTIVVADDAAAEAIVDEVATEQFATCISTYLTDAMAESGADATVSELTPSTGGTDLADGSAGVGGTLSLAGPDGTELNGELGFHFIRTDNVVSAVMLLDIGTTYFQDTMDGLLSTVVTRQAAELS